MFFPSVYKKGVKQVKDDVPSLSNYPDPSKWILRTDEKALPTFATLSPSEFVLGYLIALRLVEDTVVYDILYGRLMDVMQEASLSPSWERVLEAECRVKHGVDIGLFTLDNALKVQQYAAWREYGQHLEQKETKHVQQKQKLGWYKKPSFLSFSTFSEAKRAGKSVCIGWQTNACQSADHHDEKLHVCMACAINNDKVNGHPQFRCNFMVEAASD
jgi:hypothetical protein